MAKKVVSIDPALFEALVDALEEGNSFVETWIADRPDPRLWGEDWQEVALGYAASWRKVADWLEANGYGPSAQRTVARDIRRVVELHRKLVRRAPKDENIECTNCGWKGTSDQLAPSKHGNKTGGSCPKCSGPSFRSFFEVNMS
jgi:hypothetical protein